MRFIENNDDIGFVKIIAILVAVSIQYLGNTIFGNNEKKYK